MFTGHAVIMNNIDKGSKTIRQTMKYNGKTIILRDTYSIISSPLSAFPFMFGLKTGDKEVCPYQYLTNELLQQGIFHGDLLLAPGVGVIKEAGLKEKRNKWNQQRFEENIKKHGFYVDEDGHTSTEETDYFDAKKYLSFYCVQDVNILAAGFDKFRELCLEGIKIDVDECLTAPSLAQKYFEINLYTKIENYYKYAGVIREYIQGCVVGGRTMTRDNLKWHVEHRYLYDFDARSLYPSAMYRAWIQTGKPIILKPEECNLKYLLEHTCEEQ